MMSKKIESYKITELDDFALQHSCPDCGVPFDLYDRVVTIFLPKNIMRIYVHWSCLDIGMQEGAPDEKVQERKNKTVQVLEKWERQLSA